MLHSAALCGVMAALKRKSARISVSLELREVERLSKIASAQRLHVSVSAIAGYAIRLFLEWARDDQQLGIDLGADSRGRQ